MSVAIDLAYIAVVVLVGCYIGSALERIAHALEQANGIARSAVMFPDDPPAP